MNSDCFRTSSSIRTVPHYELRLFCGLPGVHDIQHSRNAKQWSRLWGHSPGLHPVPQLYSQERDRPLWVLQQPVLALQTGTWHHRVQSLDCKWPGLAFCALKEVPCLGLVLCVLQHPIHPLQPGTGHHRVQSLDCKLTWPVFLCFEKGPLPCFNVMCFDIILQINCSQTLQHV